MTPPTYTIWCESCNEAREAILTSSHREHIYRCQRCGHGVGVPRIHPKDKFPWPEVIIAVSVVVLVWLVAISVSCAPSSPTTDTPEIDNTQVTPTVLQPTLIWDDGWSGKLLAFDVQEGKLYIFTSGRESSSMVFVQQQHLTNSQ